jgi:hypothetical protein
MTGKVPIQVMCHLDRNEAEIPRVAAKFFNVASVEVF